MRRAFFGDCFKAIEQAIQASEQLLGGEIRFAVESGLNRNRLLEGQSARERAVNVFFPLSVWDTERNNGVLNYLLLADHAVEIETERGIHSKVLNKTGEAICRNMQTDFS